MRIGLSCTVIEPAITQGKIDGIGTYTKSLYDEFIKHNHQVIPVSFPTETLTASALPNGQLFPSSYTHSILMSMLKPLQNDLRNHIDLLHVTDHMVPKLKHIPVIATVHDATMFKYPQWYFNSKLGNLKKWMRKKSLSWADHVITGSPTMIPELVDYCGIDPKKISVVYDGISPWWSESLSSTEKKNLLSKFNLPEKFLLFTGTLHPKKNLPRLIQAYLQLPSDIQTEYPLIVAGRAGWDADESLASIRHLIIRKRGRWLDYVTIEELRALFQSASVYVHPSLHEGFGLTLLQAFASHTPVLTSNITAMPDTAGGAAYLVDPYSIDSIKNGLEKMITSLTLQNELREKGIHRVKQFGWEQCAQETIKIYQSII